MNPVTFNISVGAIPENFEGNLQATLELFASRLIISPSVPWSSFVVGGAQPSSNVGPWLKDSIELWVWSDALATYIPQVIGSEALQYDVSVAMPDPSKYKLWVDLTSPASLKYSDGVLWTDVYGEKFALYSTTADMHTAISAAVGGAVDALAIGKGLFSAKPSVVQNVVFPSLGSQNGNITFGTEEFDPDAAFDASKFVAPADGYYQFNFAVWTAMSGGTPSEVDMFFSLTVNGTSKAFANNIDGPFTRTGGLFVGSGLVYLSAGNEVRVRYDISTDAAVTVEIQPTGTFLSGYRVR